MTQFDAIYESIVNTIIKDGYSSGENVRAKYSDGTPATYRSVTGINFTYDNSTSEAPVLTTRYTPYKSAVREIYWVWLLRSNNVDILTDLGCKYWAEWASKDEQGNNTIRKAYGYQLAQQCMGFDNQVDYVINELKTNPTSRRILTSMWNVEDLPEMNLQPCVFLTMWNVLGNRLDLRVIQRSCDIALGLVSNLCQYAVLHKLIAHECGLKPGKIHWSIGDAHLYEEHIPTIQQQLSAPENLIEPRLEIKLPEPGHLYDFHPDDVIISNYTPSSLPQYKFKIAI